MKIKSLGFLLLSVLIITVTTSASAQKKIGQRDP